MISFDREFLENLEEYHIWMELDWNEDTFQFTFYGIDDNHMKWRAIKTLTKVQMVLIKTMSANAVLGDTVDDLIEHMEGGEEYVEADTK